MWALGLMSGTSADGIDAALIHTDGFSIMDFGPTHYMSYSPELKQLILEAYGRKPTNDTIPLAQKITEQHAQVIKALLEKTNIKPEVIGFHGQTIFHRPPDEGRAGETVQLGNGEWLASHMGIPVIDQFRVNDVAHGGQGAPLVPLFHQALARDLPKPLAILNIGGIANVTWIGENSEDILAFDTGPGNALIDDWIFKHTGEAWDENGLIASLGNCHEDLIKKWLDNPYFKKKPPKSLDRQNFHSYLNDVCNLTFEDGAATLTSFTAATIHRGTTFFPSSPKLWIIAGGGAHNDTLIKMLRQYIGDNIKLSSELAWNNDALEAQAFGFLAVRSLKGMALSLPGTTGVPYPLTGGTKWSI